MSFNTDKEVASFFSKQPGMQMMPYHYEHLRPEDTLSNIVSNRSIAINVNDCVMFFNIWENGVPGIIYTQTGLQSSLVRKGWKRTSVLKWYEKYVKGDNDPDVCTTLAKFNIKRNDVNDLRSLIEANHNKFTMDNLNAGKLHTNETFY